MLTAIVSYLQPILDFAIRLVELGNLSREVINALFRVMGICLLSQIAGFVCADAGNQTLSKVLQIVTSVLVLHISIPLLEEVVSLIEKVMGDI